MHVFSRWFPTASVSNQLFSLFPSRGFCSKHAALLLFRRLRFWGGKMESLQIILFLQPAWLAGKHKMCLLNSLVERGRASQFMFLWQLKTSSFSALLTSLSLLLLAGVTANKFQLAANSCAVNCFIGHRSSQYFFLISQFFFMFFLFSAVGINSFPNARGGCLKH